MFRSTDAGALVLCLNACKNGVKAFSGLLYVATTDVGHMGGVWIL